MFLMILLLTLYPICMYELSFVHNELPVHLSVKSPKKISTLDFFFLLYIVFLDNKSCEAAPRESRMKKINDLAVGLMYDF